MDGEAPARGNERKAAHGELRRIYFGDMVGGMHLVFRQVRVILSVLLYCFHFLF